MVYCPQCGNPNFDDANFCDTCGEPLVRREVYERLREQAEAARSAEERVRQKQAQAYDRAYNKAKRDAERASSGGGARSVAAGVGDAAYSGGVGTASSGAQPGAAGPYSDAVAGVGATCSNDARSAHAASGASSSQGAAKPDLTVYKHGCVAQAWDDITESPGWFKKTMLLGLVNVVPILNFYVQGYAMDWASQLQDDRVEPMPRKVFGEGYFKQGFFAFVLFLVWGIALAVASGVFAGLPLIGGLIDLALSLLFMVFVALSVMRTAISKEIGSGFDVKEIWFAIFKADFGKALGATMVPGLITGAIAAFACVSLVVIFGLTYITSISQLLSMGQTGYLYGYGYDYDYVLAAIVELVVALLPLVAICYLVCSFADALGTLWTWRATSHYVMRCCSGWRALSPSAPVFGSPSADSSSSDAFTASDSSAILIESGVPIVSDAPDAPSEPANPADSAEGEGSSSASSEGSVS